ncbi:MAG: hypothetical protein Q9O74_11675, partial [Planctomycetota bacterium]|nr:hypothetical protein [Planctomycetota bacterium]
TWTGAVAVNSTALAPVPYYNNIAEDIGGGAVGLVPYYLHYNDCTPTATKVNENQTTGLDGYDPTQCVGIHIDEVLIPNEPLPSVTLHHYGPVLCEGTGMPVTIHRRQMAAACAWETEDIAPNFTLVMHPGGNLREVRIDGPFAEGYYYLIEPKDENETDYLYCDDLDVSVGKVAVHDYDLVMRVRRIQDITLNGLLEPDDIVAWIAAPTDTTLDGTTDNADLVDVIEAVTNSND